VAAGSFPLPEREAYFGLRVRGAADAESTAPAGASGTATPGATQGLRQRSLILPVNITVGAAGSVLVSFKGEAATPPYRLENRCHDIAVRVAQARTARTRACTSCK
jgi:hypothetical protein